PLLERRGRWFHLSHDNLVRAERWFDRWQALAVLVGRVTPVIRSFISIPAGVFETPFARYTLLTAIGSAIWAFAFAGIGWAAGRSYERFHHDFGYLEYALVAAILILLAFWIYRRLRPSSPSRGASDPARWRKGAVRAAAPAHPRGDRWRARQLRLHPRPERRRVRTRGCRIPRRPRDRRRGERHRRARPRAR